MSQEFNKIALTDKINGSLSILLKRDETALTLSAGEQEPQDIEAGMEGRLCLRTDLKVLKVLTSVTPVVWETLIDFGTENATKQWVEENYQPVNSNLTALSSIVSESNKIPYFESENSMSTIDYTSFGGQILKAETAEEVRNILELRKLSTVDQITSENVDELIADSSITKEKLAYEPITSEQGYMTGDIKETYNEKDEPGWITLSGYDETKIEEGEIIYGCFSSERGYFYVETPYHVNDPVYVTKNYGLASSISELQKHFKFTVKNVNSDGTIDFLIFGNIFGSDIIEYNVPNYPEGDLKNKRTVIELSGGTTIGNSESGAIYAGQDYNELFTKVWGSSSISFQDSLGEEVSRGSSANSDWTSNRRLVLPGGFKYINPHCCYKIKI